MAIDRSMPVLIADDSDTMIVILRRMLHQLGFRNVDAAGDGATALAKMRAKHYGLVISDWNMEAMSGYDFLREMRRDAGLKRTPFIMMTSESRTDNLIAAKKAGVDNYIVKPFDVNTLKTKINTVYAARTAVVAEP